MKVEIDKQKATRLINPGQVILVTSGYKDKSNITACAWSMPLSHNPASVAIALAKKHFSSELIRQSQEFIINVPDWKLLDRVILCGSCSGREINKFAKVKLTPEKSHSLSKTPKVKECVASLECALIDVKEVVDHYVFFGEVLHAEAENDYFVNDLWDTNKVELIFHLGSHFFFKSSPYVEFKI